MQDLSIDIKTMPQAFGGYHLLLVITCDQTNFMIAVPLRDRTAQTVAEALIYRVIYLFGPPRQIICDEATEFSSAIIQAILCMLNCRLKVISPYNHGSSKCERQIQMISEIIIERSHNLQLTILYMSLKLPHFTHHNVVRSLTSRLQLCCIQYQMRGYGLISRANCKLVSHV